MVQRSLQCGLVPFPVRARDHCELLASPGWPDIQATPGKVLFLDGLDEAIAQREEVMPGLNEIMRLRPALITSRLREYEHELSPLLSDTGFDEVYVLLPWRVETEFGDFLDRLGRVGMVAETASLAATVQASEPLSLLVTRPLYARMLTFIGEAAAKDINHTAALYGQYLTKLARVAEISAGVSAGAMRTWRAAAWAAHASGVQAGDSVTVGELVDVLPNDLARLQVRRMLDLILNVRRAGDREVGEFLHYSFFEYLVAAQVCDTLLSQPDARSVHAALRHDLTREIRHHLTAQLRAIHVPHHRETLVTAYEAARIEGTTSEARAICNLLVYLLSRTVPQSETPLLKLLDAEQDRFLAAAILWALCHLGTPGSDRRFFDWLDRDPIMRSLCRGYVLYYYGDIDRNDGPPYTDEPPYRACSNTLRIIMDVFDRSMSTEKVSALRRAIDLYTFLDILAVRNLPLPTPFRDRIQNFHAALQSEGVDAKLWAHLAEMVRIQNRVQVEKTRPES